MPLHYERRGSGAPLVLLHGVGHRWQAWEPVMERLAARHDVVAVDLPGFGKSVFEERYDVPRAVARLAEFFAELGLERPHVAGNSLGALLALEAASLAMWPRPRRSRPPASGTGASAPTASRRSCSSGR